MFALAAFSKSTQSSATCARSVFQFFFPRYLLHSLMRRLCAGVSSNHFENCEWHQRLLCSKSSTKQPDGLSSAYQRCIKPFFRLTAFFPPTTQLPGCISKKKPPHLRCLHACACLSPPKHRNTNGMCALCLRLSSRNVRRICEMWTTRIVGNKLKFCLLDGTIRPRAPAYMFQKNYTAVQMGTGDGRRGRV
jgi:hypothetical protein